MHPIWNRNPDPVDYLKAARELARFRMNATASLTKRVLPTEKLNHFTINSSYYYKQLIELSQQLGSQHQLTLQAGAAWFLAQLEQLDHEVPLTLIHHDFAAINLVVHEGRVMPIDWSNAYLGRHLSDLYCLIREAEDISAALPQAIRLAYADEKQLPPLELEKLLRLGGICWHIQTISWLLNGGVQAIPGSEAWIPGLFDELADLLKPM